MNMKFRQVIRKLHGKDKMVLQVRKWWWPCWANCWYTEDDDWYILTTDIKYPPEIENIKKDELYYSFLNLMHLPI